MRLVLSIVAHGFLLFLLGFLFPYQSATDTGVLSSANWQLYFAGGAILGLLNGILKPVLKIIGFPFAILSFGLFSLAVNIILLLALQHIILALNVSGVVFSIRGFGYLALSVVIFTIFNILYAVIFHR